MLTDLKETASRSEDYEIADFRRASSILLMRQFIYMDDPRDRRYYLLVAEHQEYFIRLFDALGWRLHFDKDFGFAGILPDPGEPALPLKRDEVLILLCLRLIYEEDMESFNTDSGSVWVDSNSVMSRYDALLKIERPKFSRLSEIFSLFARHGIIERKEDEEERNLRIRIRPAIRLVLPERYLARLELFLGETDERNEGDDAAAVPEGEENVEATGEGADEAAH